MSGSERRPRGRPKNPKPASPPPREEPGDRQYAALRHAMAGQQAACVDDDMFTADLPDVPIAKLARMRGVCAACPVFAECATYARVGRPRAGFWAGAHSDRRSK